MHFAVVSVVKTGYNPGDESIRHYSGLDPSGSGDLLGWGNAVPLPRRRSSSQNGS